MNFLVRFFLGCLPKVIGILHTLMWQQYKTATCNTLSFHTQIRYFSLNCMFTNCINYPLSFQIVSTFSRQEKTKCPLHKNMALLIYLAYHHFFFWYNYISSFNRKFFFLYIDEMTKPL
jgi:hypothetical protein